MIDPMILAQIEDGAFRRAAQEAAQEPATQDDLMYVYVVVLGHQKAEWRDEGDTPRFRRLCRVLGALRGLLGETGGA